MEKTRNTVEKIDVFRVLGTFPVDKSVDTVDIGGILNWVKNGNS